MKKRGPKGNQARPVKAISVGELFWGLPLFDNLFLSMQGQNVMLVDGYLRDLEYALLARKVVRLRRDRQPTHPGAAKGKTTEKASHLTVS